VRYAALLRGVNVGTSVRVPMKDLQTLLGGLGFTRVVTYLNSGNAVFDTPGDEDRSDELRPVVEGALAQAFGQPIPTLVKSATVLAAVAALIPAGWQNDDDQRTDVAYLFPGALDPGLVASLPLATDLVTVLYDHGALVWNVSRENVPRSRLDKLIGHPVYRLMTVRNVNTARKLAELTAQ
jgi:uncharacterized protein (DUF1697 family)